LWNDCRNQCPVGAIRWTCRASDDRRVRRRGRDWEASTAQAVRLFRGEARTISPTVGADRRKGTPVLGRIDRRALEPARTAASRSEGATQPAGSGGDLPAILLSKSRSREKNRDSVAP